MRDINETLKEELLSIYNKEIITNLSKKNNILYRKIYNLAKKENKSVYEYIEKDLHLITEITKKQIEKDLLKLYPNKVVYKLSSKDISLYRKIYNLAKKFDIDITTFLKEKLDFAVDKYSKTFIDTKTISFIKDNFSNFNHACIYDYLGYSRQNYFVKLDKKRNYTGEWLQENLTSKIKKKVKNLIKENKDTSFKNNQLTTLLYKDSNFYVLYINFKMKEGFFSEIKDNNLIKDLKKKKYGILFRDEYSLYTKLLKAYNPIEVTQEYYEILTSKKSVEILKKRVQQHGFTSLKDYVENEWNMRFIHSNNPSPKEMHRILSQYKIKEPNYIKIDTHEPSTYSSLVRKARKLYPNTKIQEAFKLLSQRYGFIHINKL